MALPVVPLATGSVDIAGTTVSYRSLSRAEVVSLSDLDTGPAEVFILSRACSITPEEATAWRESVDAKTANKLLTAIAVISGLRRPPKDDGAGEA